MAKTLVAYFSASGTTKELATRLARAIDADLHEIIPAQKYTPADLDWTNAKSRSTIEMNNRAFRPAIANQVENMNRYDTVFLGFPIWWYVAPTIINTFLEQYDLTGKRIIPFATSGSSEMGNTNKELAASCSGALLLEGKRFDKNARESDLKAWAQGLCEGF